MRINKKPPNRIVSLSADFRKKARKHVAQFDTIEDAALSMGFKRWQTLSELLNRKTCRQASLDKINAALNPETVAP